MKTEKEYKYATEASLNMYLGFNQVCQQDEFSILENDEDLKYCNIYFVCQRNRVGIKKDEIKVDENNIKLTFEIWNKDNPFTIPVYLPNTFGTNQLSIVSEYPYNHFGLQNEQNEIVYVNKPAYLLDSYQAEVSSIIMMPRPKFLDFEILYIGQAIRDSKQPAMDRLISHDTLQKISLISQSKSPDKEIYLILCHFITDGTIEIKGSVKSKKEYEKDDEKRLNKFLESKLTLTHEQQTTLTEAALIRYFKPEYNTNYKKTFPSKSHSKYDECYNLDLYGVSIEINTNLYFFTETTSTSKNHYQRFSLTTDENRKQLFDLYNDTITNEKKGSR